MARPSLPRPLGHADGSPRDPRPHRLLWRLPGAVRHQHAASRRGRRSPSSGPTGPANRRSSRRSPASCRARRMPSASRAATSAARARSTSSRHGVILVPKGGGSSPRCRSRRTCLSAATGAAGDGRSTASTRSSRSSASAAGSRRRRFPAASSRCAPSGAALMGDPRLLLCDEISLGLAPIVIRDIYASLPAIKARGHEPDHRRAGHRPGACGRRPRLLLPGGPDDAYRAGRPS